MCHSWMQWILDGLQTLLYEIHGVVEDILFRLKQQHLKMQVVIEWCEQLAQLLRAPPPVPIVGSHSDHPIQLPKGNEQKQTQLHDNWVSSMKFLCWTVIWSLNFSIVFCHSIHSCQEMTVIFARLFFYNNPIWEGY